MECGLKSKIKAVVKKMLGVGGLEKINYVRNCRLLNNYSFKDFKLLFKALYSL